MASEETQQQPPETIEMPAPTAWPLVTALGVTLGFAGLVTNVAVSLVGLVLSVRGAVGWWQDVLPTERVERIPMRLPEQRAKPITLAPQAVEHLKIGEGGHRLRIPVEIHPYSAGITGGIVGGMAMALVALAYGFLAYGSLWYPVNLLAAAALPALAEASLAQLRAFYPLGLIVALVSHGLISLFVGLLYAAILPTLPRYSALWGGLVAPLLWSSLIWASLGIINPVLNQRIDWVWFVASQIAFGLATGAVVTRTQRVPTRQAEPLATELSLQTPERHPEKEQPR